MTDDAKDRESFNEASQRELLAHAEPGISLKVADEEEQQQIAQVVTKLTEDAAPILDAMEKPELPSLESAEAQDQLESVDKPPTAADLYSELKRLPLIWTGAGLALLCAVQPDAVLVVCYVYWVFCMYSIGRVASRVLNAKFVLPNRILFVALFPIYSFLLISVMSIASHALFAMRLYILLPLTSLAVIVCWLFSIFYHSKWGVNVAVAIKKRGDQYQIKNRLPAWIEYVTIGSMIGLGPIVLPLYIGSVILLEIGNGGIGNIPISVKFCLGILAILLQFGPLYAVRARIRGAALYDPEMTELSQTKKKFQVKVSDDDYVVRYRAFAEWERWFKQRFSERSNKKLIYLLVMLFLFFALGAPQFALDMMVKIASGAGGANGVAGSSVVADNINFLNMFQSLLIGVAGGIGLLYMSRPTHVGFSRKGVRFLWRHRILEINGTYVKWDAFKQIRLVMPKGKTSPSDQQLLFDANSPTGVDRDVTVKLACVLEVDDKERILKAIEAFAPQVQRDASVLQVLQPPADHSYTELWLQALAAPPKRERFKPLSVDSALQDGRFKIQGQLGVGGQGTAYLAYDKETKSTVVLKEFILPVYVDVAVRRQALERFENEARILKQLDHDQIVKLDDFFVEDHRSYLVLEHIEGKSLKQIVEEQGPMSEIEVVRLANQMCTMLEYLHGLSPPVVHRDFTPDNLILRNDGKLKLVDFNVAQQTDSTATGTVVGKHAYLPPEQFRGTPVPQSDLYAMGATMHYLLTGKDPEPISVSHPKKVDQNVSDAMDLFVAKATAMTLEARHQDVKEIQTEIEDLFGVSLALADGLLDPPSDETVAQTEPENDQGEAS